MKAIFPLAACLLLGPTVIPLWAQTALDRVEQQLQQDVVGSSAGSAAPAEAADAEPGYLGILADDRQEQGRGIRVLNVVAGGPAEQGGLRTGDLITSIAGQTTKQMDDMAKVMQGLTAGQEVEFQVERNGAKQSLEVTLGSRPALGQPGISQPGPVPAELPAPAGSANTSRAPATPPAGPRLGVRTVPISEEARRQFNLPDTRGALVTSVTVGSPADRARIPLGAAITAIDGQEVKAPDDLAILLSSTTPGSEIEVTFNARGQEVRRRVRLAAAAAGAPPARSEVGPRPIDADPRTDFVPPTRTESPIEVLERRIRELEARVEKLEAALAKPTAE